MSQLTHSLLQQRRKTGSTVLPVLHFPNFLDLPDQSVTGIQAAWSIIAAFYPGYETRLLGFGGLYTNAGLDGSYTTVWVTNTSDNAATPGSFRYALLQAGKTIIKFAITDDIVDPNRRGYDCTDNTLIDGRGYPGTIYGAITAANVNNIAGQYLNVTQPFPYSGSVSGAAIGNINIGNAYWYKINMWDTGDVVFTNGAYYPYGGNSTWGPFYFTVDSCRIGPNPGEYAIMAPIKPIKGVMPDGVYPGYLNNINNDARNGKAAESALDHNSIEAGNVTHDQLAHTTYGTYIHSICQGCCARNFKSRSQYVDTVSCLVTKYGEDYNRGGSVGPGQGATIDNDGFMNVRGCVFIPYVNGEAFVGFQPAVAQRNGIPPWYVTNMQAKAFAVGSSGSEGGQNYNNAQNAHVYDSWLKNQLKDTAPATAGFDWTPYYTLNHTNCDDATPTGYANSQVLVTLIEDDPLTRAGNPCATLQPPNWRNVHTGTTFPVIL